MSTLQDLSNDTKNTPMRGVFLSCCRALNVRESLRTPNPQLFQVLGFTPTLGQVRVATGLEVNVFFSPSLEMWNEEGGKRLNFFLEMFFSLWRG